MSDKEVARVSRMSKIEAVLDRLQSSMSLTIVCHDDPDPDSISAAIALELLARGYSVETVDIVYGGTIMHQQNRAFVDLFDVKPKRYSKELMEANELVAFVDHSFPGEHNPIPEETEIDIVIDHHQSGRSIPADVVDIREEYGSTATILAEYVHESHVEITPRAASALLFGIHRERLDFYQQPTDREYGVANYLHERADSELLRDLYSASFMPDSIDALENILLNRIRRGSCLVSCIGRVRIRVMLAQGADLLLTVDGIDTVLVCGIVRDEIHLSGRTIRTDLDLSNCFDRLFGNLGSTGGHKDMAGGQIPLDTVAKKTDDEDEVIETVRTQIGNRFIDAIHSSFDKPEK